MGNLLLDGIVIAAFSTADIIYFSSNSILFLLFGFCCWFLYKKLRPKFPCRVNCWFCNKNTTISYNLRDCWDCPHCDQYNGFTKEGDYNDDVQRRKGILFSSSPSAKTPLNEPTNGLCEMCNINQRLKVEQLANFTPMYEDNYDDEIDHFRELLEKFYKLCHSCEKTLTQKLEGQKIHLLTSRVNNMRKSRNSALLNLNLLPINFQVRHNIFVFLRRISFLLNVVIFVSVASLLAEKFFVTSWISTYGVIEYETWKALVAVFLSWAVEISLMGLILYFITLYGRGSRLELSTLSLLLLTHTFCWTNHLQLLFISSILTIVQYSRTLNMRICYFPKKDLPQRKYSGNCVVDAPILPKKAVNLGEALRNSLNSMDKNRDLNKSEVPKAEVQNNTDSPIEVKNFKVKTISRGTSPFIERPEPYNIQTRSRTLTKLEKTEKFGTPDKVRHTSPPPEVYSGFSSLHLSTPGEKEINNKPKNFLFEPVNYNKSEKKNSLIKPAKFVPNPGISGTPPLLDLVDAETSSRCSSVNLKSNSTFPEALSPICSKYSPSTGYGYSCPDYAMPPGYYVTGYTPPYGSFSSPIGHTTVFSYSQPANLPYGFPHKRFSPSYDFNTLESPRLSEVSSSRGSEILFGRSLDEGKWSWIRKNIFTTNFFNSFCCVIALISSLYLYVNPR